MCIRDRAEVAALLAKGHVNFADEVTLGTAPVSYTHLDVYKRQPDMSNRSKEAYKDENAQ